MIGNLFVISGPSGVGKDTLMALIFKEIPYLSKWITCTTRKPREGEVDGVNYFFKTREEFLSMISNNDLVEYNEYAGNLYGTPKKFVNDMLKAGKSIITAIDVNGAERVKKSFPDAHLIFIEPPSIEELRRRLINRGTEDEKTIEDRIAIMNLELCKKNEFDAIFVNDDLKKSCNEIACYIKQFLK